MAEDAAATTGAPTLSKQYLLKGKEEQTDAVSKSVEVKEDKNPVAVVSEEVVEKAEEPSAPAAEEKTEDTPAAAEESTETPTTAESNSEDVPVAAEEAAEENSGEEAAEGKREIKIETAPADYRFPTTNQTRHCFTRYIEYHRCVAAKGEGASECDKFAKYYRSLCPSEWVERWNEQRENGTFPGPL